MNKESFIYLILTLLTGFFLFQLKEWYKSYRLRVKAKNKLSAKLQFWMLDSRASEFESIYSAGLKLSKDFDYIAAIIKNKDLKKDLETKLDEIIKIVFEELKKSESFDEMKQLFDNLHEERYKFIINYFDKFENHFNEGTALLDKAEVSSLDSKTQIYYHNLHHQIIELMVTAKSTMIKVRFEHKDDSNDNEVEDGIGDIIKSGLKATIAFHLLLNRIK